MRSFYMDTIKSTLTICIIHCVLWCVYHTVCVSAHILKHRHRGYVVSISNVIMETTICKKKCNRKYLLLAKTLYCENGERNVG